MIVTDTANKITPDILTRQPDVLLAGNEGKGILGEGTLEIQRHERLSGEQLVDLLNTNLGDRSITLSSVEVWQPGVTSGISENMTTTNQVEVHESANQSSRDFRIVETSQAEIKGMNLLQVALSFEHLVMTEGDWTVDNPEVGVNAAWEPSNNNAHLFFPIDGAEVLVAANAEAGTTSYFIECKRPGLPSSEKITQYHVLTVKND
ncbi:hypothetical protein KBC75_01740 [Candidatus Shapirobacteria bacterium]|nr:hypothetical protein [Candidatus Shapirobacteria bacterium]